MKLGEYLDKDLIIHELSASTKTEVLAELVKPVIQKYPELDQNTVVRILQDRENLGTTGIGDGIAIPHGKVEGLDHIVLVVGRSSEGLDFEALDYKLCNVFFLVLAPEQVAGMHLRILAQISRLLKDKEFRAEFAQADSEDTLWELLQKA
ncbi:putative PTS IIA-like nitrogen-regulatory protein PtsN [Oleidesulfovibrio alaskensis G20]|jgi:PTS system nitrogen regulatory IIA component|uniref:Putative PTS IIA-like nitrogen-regulatory protein PtsN n=1 Tax=Oleidesulfovibrio alaskensis (strain ATCC BAA-1058 / DSM 17464 / G20) TaxID=207559 RepID=Q310S6_OLEA2|nr:PTS sugar transporter subunit IIA [Oleidesulfovibrio alaskensis]ABB38570.1 putative PTS IIA-like nitrogen-regulatory protein PtsN [Oleidesulfovibrio alaskensis G20]MBG0774605.1 PTS sugar transporter subunit IIA [Oleidesulfovibrio alaskensis]MBL3581586.1 PTS sugar transporter subunit IIA [Oleidesulfovibrio alaskensis]MBL3588065.1 PTS sugar transporter subunit IIA [bacterium]